MKILVPVDGSKYSEEALKIAIDYAKTKGANICLINVIPYIEGIDLEISASERDRLIKSLEKRGEYIVQQACGILAAEDIIATCRHIVASVSIPDAIIDYAEKEKIDLIIIGSRGLSKSSRFKLGSVASKVVRHAPCSVYVVKLPE
ncbi:MAG: universal stress protein [Thermodesulfovibrionales bacterium]|nr:universal stress protein [Thermodesulfovibrionales bacterium]